MPQSALLSEGGGGQSLFGQCPNRPGILLIGPSLILTIDNCNSYRMHTALACFTPYSKSIVEQLAKHWTSSFISCIKLQVLQWQAAATWLYQMMVMIIDDNLKEVALYITKEASNYKVFGFYLL